jgi:predicted dehydrogenase
MEVQRRTFIRGLTGAVSAAAVMRPRRADAANDTLVGGLMGAGGRGNQLAQILGERKDVDMKYVCDVDQSKFARVCASLDDATGRMPKRINDFRVMLDDPDVDFVVIATPVHWHALATVLACQAGKHVYVEKPVSQNLWEGRKMVEAARKYNRVVQGGMQNRSAPYLYKAEEFVKSGKMGEIHQVRVVQMVNSRSTWKADEQPIPEGLDWDMYLGPSVDRTFTGTRVNRLAWDFTCGPIIDDAIHHLDIARWVTGLQYPHSAHSTGGIFARQDDRETPDTQIMTWEYDNTLMTLHGSLAMPYMVKRASEHLLYHPEIMETEFPNWLFDSTHTEIFGTEGAMMIGRHGGGWQVFGPDGAEMDSMHGRLQSNTHVGNFLDCVRSGDKPVCDIEDAHISNALAHIGNISYRLGHRQLDFDGAKERFVNDSEANGLLKRKYRAPWVIPDKV